MITPELNDPFRQAILQVDRIVGAVTERGYDDVSEETDDYGALLQSFEFRKLVTFGIYDGYFPPKRHEFELQLLTELVDAVASSKPVSFLAGAAVAGVVGNAIYDMLRKTIGHIVRRLKNVKRSRDTFQEIGDNLARIRAYFRTHNDVRTDEICRDLGIEAHKIEPLLKLLGFRRRRKRKRQVWLRPDSW